MTFEEGFAAFTIACGLFLVACMAYAMVATIRAAHKYHEGEPDVLCRCACGLRSFTPTYVSVAMPAGESEKCDHRDECFLDSFTRNQAEVSPED